jgi:diketogulonate reductase-like aldo/keto reductase
MYVDGRPIGPVIAAPVMACNDPRVTTQVWNENRLPTQSVFDTSRKKLSFDRVDLYLVHELANLAAMFVRGMRPK